MTKLTFLSWLPITLLLNGCSLVALQGSGNVVTETRSISAIEEVEICCGMNLVLTQGEQEQLILEAEDNVMPEIETIVDGRKLVVRFHSNFSLLRLRLHRPVIVRLQMKTVHRVAVSGGGSLETEQLNSDQFALEFSGGSHGQIGNLQTTSASLVTNGGGEVTIDRLTSDTLTVEINGGGHVTIGAGSAGAQQVQANGGSHYNAADVESKTARVEAGGGSEARLWVVEALHVQASGGSHVEYSGNPAVEQQITGGSDLRAANRS